ncbi:hypothetical protein L249_5394, partial [Ophiocordyceps polyrhachis-furcata BCC 54312]
SELLYFIRARTADTSSLTLDSSVVVPTQEARMLSTCVSAFGPNSSSDRTPGRAALILARTRPPNTYSSAAPALASESLLLLGSRPGPLLLHLYNVAIAIAVIVARGGPRPPFYL